MNNASRNTLKKAMNNFASRNGAANLPNKQTGQKTLEVQVDL